MTTVQADLVSGLTYRRAVAEDAEELSRLIIASQEQYTFHEFSETGRENMRRACSSDALHNYLCRGDIYFVAEAYGSVVGLIGIREHAHVAHNFVVASWHRRGVSTALWTLGREACMAAGNDGIFTLQASTFAIPVYLRWGFEKTGEMEEVGGIRSTPMRLIVG